MAEAASFPSQPCKRGRPFQPGQSGNPAGRRPRGSDRAGDVSRIMAGGAAQVARKMVAQALAGDVDAARLVLEQGLAPGQGSGPAAAPCGERAQASGAAA